MLLNSSSKCGWVDKKYSYVMKVSSQRIIPKCWIISMIFPLVLIHLNCNRCTVLHSIVLNAGFWTVLHPHMVAPLSLEHTTWRTGVKITCTFCGTWSYGVRELNGNLHPQAIWRGKLSDWQNQLKMQQICACTDSHSLIISENLSANAWTPFPDLL